ncbi:MAG: ATP-binding cassette domain-containing protein, partial [Elusimicrobiota bacterium]
MNENGPILSVRGLKVEFRLEDRTVRAVDGVGYDLFPGKTLAVVGESGSGKSVHALSLLGLLPRTARVVSGEALFHGEDLLAASEERLRAIRG